MKRIAVRVGRYRPCAAGRCPPWTAASASSPTCRCATCAAPSCRRPPPTGAGQPLDRGQLGEDGRGRSTSDPRDALQQFAVGPQRLGGGDQDVGLGSDLVGLPLQQPDGASRTERRGGLGQGGEGCGPFSRAAISTRSSTRRTSPWSWRTSGAGGCRGGRAAVAGERGDGLGVGRGRVVVARPAAAAWALTRWDWPR